jgi:hypothetical protein
MVSIELSKEELDVLGTWYSYYEGETSVSDASHDLFHKLRTIYLNLPNARPEIGRPW